MRILIVDDYPGAVEAGCILLQLLGHECRTATSGQAALDQLATFDADIILLDIGLPDISGYDVARAIRSGRNGERAFIAALSGRAEADDRIRSQAAGIDLHLEKPPSRMALEAVVRAAAERGSGPAT